MKRFLSIIRWPNLIMLGIIQAMVFFRLLEWKNSVLGYWDIALLIVITMILAAGGYIINDYYDRNIDRINKPDLWIAGNQWSVRKVLVVYLIVTSLGLILSVWLAMRLDLLSFLFLYPLSAGGLWLYSCFLKCKPVAGNLWVSIFCAGVILIVATPDLINGKHEMITLNFWYYIAFAFLATWYREIIKDIEDVEGDQALHCNTVVVRWGLKAGKMMAILLSIILIITLLQWESTQTSNIVKFGLYVLQGVLVASASFVWWAKNKSYYHTASTMVKLVMLTGTFLLLL